MTRKPACALSALGLLALLACDESGNSTAADFTLSCSATPTSGSAPLGVSFATRVTGTTESVTFTVNYGDGTTSSDPATGHVYTRAGVYNAQFSAQARGGGSASCSSTITVTAPPAPPLTPATNSPPSAVFKTDPPAPLGPITGPAPFEVRFNMCPTVDPEGDLLLFTIDFETDGRFEEQGTTGADCRGAGTYAEGTYTATACVTDVASDLTPLHAPQCQAYTIVVTP
jgi:hypothetical protein